MKNKIRNSLLALSLLIALSSCKSGATDHPEWKVFFDSAGIQQGCIVVLDNNTSMIHSYNAERCSKRFLPASTFKYLNSLIALQTKVAPDEHLVLHWDSVVRPIAAWNHDLDMRTAFRVSAVWYYQELARRIGEDHMASYLKETGYGNEVMGGKIDSFWLNGKLAISPDEQVEFMKNLYDGRLPFGERAMKIVKDISLLQDTLGYKLHGKTGWGQKDGQNIGWFVGWVETKDNVYFFALNIGVDQAHLDTEKFLRCRRQITEQVLHALHAF